MVAKMPSHVLWPDEATMAFWALKLFTIHIEGAINCRVLHCLDDSISSSPTDRELCSSFFFFCSIFSSFKMASQKTCLSVERGYK